MCPRRPRVPCAFVQAPATGDTWIGVTDEPLSVGAAYDWCVLPSCGAVVLFSGTVRDHAEGRQGVQHLTYEAYEEQAVAKLVEHRRRAAPALAGDRPGRAAAPHGPARAG